MKYHYCGKPQKQQPRKFVNYYEYIQTEAWAKKSRQRFALDGYQCQLCGSAKNIVCHHLNYYNLGNEKMDDLVTLCADCHRKLHDKDKKKKAKETVDREDLEKIQRKLLTYLVVADKFTPIKGPGTGIDIYLAYFSSMKISWHHLFGNSECLFYDYFFDHVAPPQDSAFFEAKSLYFSDRQEFSRELMRTGLKSVETKLIIEKREFWETVQENPDMDLGEKTPEEFSWQHYDRVLDIIKKERKKPYWQKR